MSALKSVYVKVGGIPAERINNGHLFRAMLRQIVSRLGYTTLKESFVNFKPQGLTGVIILGESHISIHTWPEKSLAVLGMVTCKKFETREKALIKSILRDTLKPRNLVLKTIS
jgi:S-adenosylmethionine decarboxylase